MFRAAEHSTTHRSAELLRWVRACFRTASGRLPARGERPRPLSLREERRLLRMAEDGLARFDEYLTRQAAFDAWCLEQTQAGGRQAAPPGA